MANFQLVDTDTLKRVSLPDDQIIPALKSGRYTVEKGQKIKAIHPITKKIFDLDSEGIHDAINEGYKFATDEQVEKNELGLEFGDRPVAAGAAGLARGLTFGVSDLILRKFGFQPKELKALEELNPVSSIAGDIIGTAGPLILSGGAALAPKAAGAGIKSITAGQRILQASKAAARKSPAAALDSLAQRAGKAVGKATLNNVAKNNPKVAKIASEVTRGAVDGLGFSAGRGLTDSAMLDENILPETVAARVGLNAVAGGLIGGGIGGALGLTSLGLKKMAPKMEAFNKARAEAAKEVIRFSNIRDTSILNAFGANKGFFKRYAVKDDQSFIKKASDYLRALITSSNDIDKLVNDPKTLVRRKLPTSITDVLVKSLDEIAIKNQKARKFAGKQMEESLKNLDSVSLTFLRRSENKDRSYAKRLSKEDNFQNLTKLKQDQKLKMDPFVSKEFVTARDVVNKIDREILDNVSENTANKEFLQLVNEMKEAISIGKFSDEISDMLGLEKGAVGSINDILPFKPSQLVGVRSTVNDFYKLAERSNVSPKNMRHLAGLYSDINHKLQSNFDVFKKSQFDAFKPSDQVNMFNRANDLWSVSSSVTDFIEDAVANKLSGKGMDLGDIAALATAVGGAVTGGGFGAIAGTAAALPVNVAINSLKNRGIAAITQNIFFDYRNVTKSLGKSVSNILKKTSQLAGSQSAVPFITSVIAKPAAKDDKSFKEHIEKISEEAGNIETTVERIQQANNFMSMTAPEVSSKLVDLYARGVTFLSEKTPKNPHLDPFAEWTIPDSAKEKYLRYLNAVEDPLKEFERASQGHGTHEAQEAIEFVYPELYSGFQEAAMFFITENPDKYKELPFNQRQALERFLKLQLSFYADPRNVQLLQSFHLQQEQPQATLKSSGVKVNIGKSESPKREATQLQNSLVR